MEVVYLGAGLGAVHDGVAAVERKRVLQFGQSLLRELVTRVDHPTVSLPDGKQPITRVKIKDTTNCNDTCRAKLSRQL